MGDPVSRSYFDAQTTETFYSVVNIFNGGTDDFRSHRPVTINVFFPVNIFFPEDAIVLLLDKNK